MSEDDTTPGGSGGILATVVPNVVRRSFALKFGIVLLVMGLSVGVIGVAATEVVQSETQKNVEEEYANVALQEGDIIDQWIQTNSLSTQLISGEDVWAGDENLDQALANEIASLPSDASDIHIVDQAPEEATIVSSTAAREGSTVGSVARGWLGDVTFNRSSEVVVSDVVDVGSGDYRVTFMSPIDASNSRFIAIEYTLEDITESLQGAERAPGGFTQVVSEDGVVQLSEPRGDASGLGPGITQAYTGDQAASQPISEASSLRGTSNESGVITQMDGSDVIGEQYTVGHSPVEDTDWVVLVHAPYSSVFGFVQQIQTWGLIATVVGVLLIGGVGAVLGWSTSSSIDRLTKKTEQMREGDLEVDLSTSRIDNIGRLYAGFAAMRDSLKEQIDEAERARKEAEVSRAEAMEMNDYLQEKAEEFSVVMERAAGGDLTERMNTDGENEAMDRIAREYNQMIEELEKTTGQLKSFADEVAESGDVVLESAESVRDASEQVADSVQKISDDAYGQKERLTDISEDLDALVDTLEGIQARNPEVDMQESIDQFTAVANSLQAAADSSEDMLAESENVAGAAEEQAAELNEVTSRADKLKRYARPLGDILDRFETEAEHEFVFSGGPSQSARDVDEDQD